MKIHFLVVNIEAFQEVASEIRRQLDQGKDVYSDFDLKNRIREDIGSGPVRSLFVKAGLLPAIVDVDYTFETVSVGMESLQKKRADKGEITLQTFGKRKDVLVLFQEFLNEEYQEILILYPKANWEEIINLLDNCIRDSANNVNFTLSLYSLMINIQYCLRGSEKNITKSELIKGI